MTKGLLLFIGNGSVTRLSPRITKKTKNKTSHKCDIPVLTPGTRGNVRLFTIARFSVSRQMINGTVKQI